MKKILVIDDEERLRTNIMELLKLEGFQTYGAKDGHLGIQLAQEQLPDLILCDVTMPDKNGYEVLESLRTNPTTNAIPFIFLTARAAMSDLRKGMNLGADDYLTKPFTRSELMGVISTRLAKQAAVTERFLNEIKQVEEKLNHLILYDTLTSLPNRRLWQEEFSLTQTRLKEKLLPVVMLGLDRFNRIISSLGHAQGDTLLKEVAEKLVSCLGSQKVISRLQAEQFAIILPPVNSPEEANQHAQALIDVLSQPIRVDNQEVFLTTSVGMAFYPQDGENADALIKNAGAAMVHAEKQGGNNFLIYNPKMNLGTSEELTLEASLRHALVRSELRVYFQPQVSLTTGQITGAEALVRWQHPERGMISPVDFIPLAEENGLIILIDEWVLRAVCEKVLEWKAKGFPLKVAVNLSARQFSQSDLSSRIANILAESGLPPNHIELELTESSIVQNPEMAANTLSVLKATGLHISIDDFGMGQSSLGYLRRFTLDTLKIDRSFVRNVNLNPKNAAITKAIIEMAHGLGLRVIAEGVETAEELAFLRQNKCNDMQGFFFSRPLPASDFEELLVSGKRLQ